jgi:hypothetical protein
MFSFINNKILHVTFLKSELLKKNWSKAQKSAQVACLPIVTARALDNKNKSRSLSEAENVEGGVAEEETGV